MAFPGSGYMIANDVMNLISNVLIEPVLSTTLGTAVTPGVQTVAPGTLTDPSGVPCVYVGAQLIVGTGGTQEVIMVSAVTATTLTANFANAHAGTDQLIGATFPVGENNNPFFTQTEVLGHISDSQNDFLTRAPIVLNITTQAFPFTQRTASNPSDCIQIERIALETTPAPGVAGGKALWEQGQTSTDLLNKYWAQAPYSTPDQWYEDRTGFEKYGITPIPGNAFTAQLLYAQRDSEALLLNEGFLLPDPFLHYVMYGALAELFGKDGEQRDPQRAKYCQQRFDLGVKVANRIYDNIMQQQTTAGG